MIRLLYLDDNPYELEEFVAGLNSLPGNRMFQATGFLEPEEFKKAVLTQRPDVAVLDIELSDVETSGIKICSWLRETSPTTLVLMRSRLDDANTLKTALEAGAFDYLLKNLSAAGVSFRIQKAWDFFRSIHEPSSNHVNIGVGKTMRQVEAKADRILNSSIQAVHIYGETGTGKEVVSEIFHLRQKSTAPFVRVNCGSLHPDLMYSQLFGHQKGAFTGAHSDHVGLFESASGGMIFMDEVALLSEAAQKGLLRVLENQEVLKLGATKPTKINIFLMSATNEKLEKLVQEGRFRQDLLQRLGETTIELPPLRDRKTEINELIDHFLVNLAGGPYAADDSIRTLLNNYDWREGNVRQLRNCIKALSEFHIGKQLTVMGAPRFLFQRSADPLTDQPQKISLSQIRYQFPLDYNLECEKLFVLIIKQVYEAKGPLSVRNLAVEIGVPRTSLTKKLKLMVDLGYFTALEIEQMIKS